MLDPQAFAAAQARNPTTNWLDKCQVFVRQALGFAQGVPGGTSARSEYTYTRDKGNIRQGTPPPNVPVYFDTKNPGGHVALSAGGGDIWTTDAAGKGVVSKTSIAKLSAQWHAPYLGWGTSEGNTDLPLGAGAVGAGLNLGGAGDAVTGALTGAAGAAAGKVAGVVGDAVVSPLISAATPLVYKGLVVLVSGSLVVLGTYKMFGPTVKAGAEKVGSAAGTAGKLAALA